MKLKASATRPRPNPLPEGEGGIPLLYPESTYRLQFHQQFTFRDAIAIIPYLAELGITHVYASPYLKAKPGSAHGYDVIDHSSINPEIGSDADQTEFVGALHKHGMSHILDIVPNHVGVGTNDNKWWNDVLAHGAASAYADYFDITWEGSRRAELGGKVLLPLLGKPYEQALEAGELQLVHEKGAYFVAYYDRRFPVNLPSLPEANSPEEVLARFNGRPNEPSSFDALDDLLQRQFYRLAHWRVAPDEINYRRFFDINDLAALRMERQEVFDATHKFIFQWIAQGKLAGLRIDHPDGLYDPKQYLERLQERFRQLRLDAPRPLYVIVEKILAVGEPLPDDWPVNGTSGYDFLNEVNGLFLDRSSESTFSEIYERITGESTSFEDLIYQKKKLILESSLASELHMLARRLDRLAQKDRMSRDFTETRLRIALAEVIACFPVYRTYIDGRDSPSPGTPGEGSVAQPPSAVIRCGTAALGCDFGHQTEMHFNLPVENTAEGGCATKKDPHPARSRSTGRGEEYVRPSIAAAICRNPQTEPAIFRFIRDMLLQESPRGFSESDRAEQLQFAGKFQQLTAPVTAKGIEDTAFYIYNRLISLNEVGGDPSRFGVTPDELHSYFADRQKHWPYALSALSTHDTKRSEDVRARINVLSEIPDEWEQAVARWMRINAPHRRHVDGEVAPSRNDEYLLYQTLVGAWPLGEYEPEPFTKRMTAYMVKALREAKVRTSWTDANEAYERATLDFVSRILDPATGSEYLREFLPFQKRVSESGMWNSLSQTLLRIAAPGVPDTYQGTELWDFSLVDPDNRRAVDYVNRQKLLEQRISARELLDNKETGQIKLFVTTRALLARREYPGLFSEGEYLPAKITGPMADHIFGFARRRGRDVALVVVPRLVAKLGSLFGADVWRETSSLIPELPDGLEFTNLFTGEHVHWNGASHPVSELLSSFPVGLWITSSAR